MVGDLPFRAMSEREDASADLKQPCPVQSDEKCVLDPRDCTLYSLYGNIARNGFCSGSESSAIRRCTGKRIDPKCLEVSDYAQYEAWLWNVGLHDLQQPVDFDEEADGLSWDEVFECTRTALKEICVALPEMINSMRRELRQYIIDTCRAVQCWPLEPKKEG